MTWPISNNFLTVHLKAKSLLIISNESRYHWSYSIAPRKIDIFSTEENHDVGHRGTRFSITFRQMD